MIIVITGPTCSSKSKIAIKVAKKINAEIINADAFQIYRELNIGTAKPDKNDLKKVKHHLYDFVAPNYNYSMFEYQTDVRKCINDILKKNKNVILVGGCGLYIRIALYDFNFKKEEKRIDKTQFDKFSNEELYEKLKKIDLESANKLHVNNRYRILRTIEIYLLNKKTKSEIEREQKHQIVYDNVYIYVIDIDRNKLYKKINKRTEIMVKKGLIEEAKKLLKKYGNNNYQSFKAIGYNEIINNNQNLDKLALTELIQKNTRNYARRQMTFIRHQYINAPHFKYVKNASDILKDIKNNQN